MAASSTCKQCVKRIIQDLRHLDSKSLEENNIYYYHDEENIMKGYAMIIGPEDTPYYHGFYFFSFEFTENYPFKPPKVTFMTYDGVTRFHPNLYINGKVCLSILNTWKGDAWTSCQSLETILMNLTMLFDSKPLLNEPGVNIRHPEVIPYNSLIAYQNINHSLMKYLDVENIPFYFKVFHDIIIDKIKNNHTKIIDNFEKSKDYSKPLRKVTIGIYGMAQYIDFIHLEKELKKKLNSFKK